MKRWVLAVSLPLVFVSHVLANDVVSGQKLGGAGTAAFNGSATAVGDVNISGTWDVLVVYANGKPDKLLTFQLRQTGNSVSGNILEPSTGKSGTISGTISGERFDFVIVTTDEPCTFTGSASVSSTGDQMTGAAPRMQPHALTVSACRV